ncbi:MAG: hypothetical protein FD122_2669 [Stygiobacter sp.]|nr:MAG: hypothetical protein FD122_2669 [Stygiobacter sp.]KAF0215204.1 MAG: hypothetical protein FD178_1843 [Ignavibacteria bacterium]
MATNLKSWMKKNCPNFYRQTHLNDGDYKLILDFARTRKFDILNFCLLMEKIYSGNLEFTIDVIDLFSSGKLNYKKIVELDNEVGELISEDAAAQLLVMRNVVEFRREILANGYLTKMTIPDRPNEVFFIKKHVLWLKEVREAQCQN